MAAEQDTAFVLHGRRFRENSRILEVFTATQGRIAVVGRVPKKHPHRVLGNYQPFQEVSLSWSGKSELQTLRSMEPFHHYGLQGRAGICGLYCNELLLYLTRKYIPMEGLYATYAHTLSRLQNGLGLAGTLREFEFVLLDELGYSPVFHEDCLTTEPLPTHGQTLYFHPAQGVSRQYLGEGAVCVSPETLQHLEAGIFDAKSTAKEIKLIFAAIIARLLNGKTLQSKFLIQSLSQQRS